MSGRIASVEPGSIAEDLGWQPGDEIITINGHELADVIDYRFYSSDEFLKVVVRRGRQTAEFEVEKDFDTSLGVEFENVLFDGVRTCGARCLFCFVDQLPRGLRPSLYLKDDDFRLSFLDGNFVTLANVSEADLHRIVEQRLSPLYVSVHATDPALRQRILGRTAPPILEQIDFLASGRITLHTQIVLCRGINDGEHLERTIRDLSERWPAVASIAVVPAGLSEARLEAGMQGIDAGYSREVLERIVKWQRAFLKGKGSRLVWAADEFFLSAGARIPRAAAYEGFPQIENGVGMVRRFKDNAVYARSLLKRGCEQGTGLVARSVDVSLVTGELAAPLLQGWADSVGCDRIRFRVHPVRNRLFGRTVTVAGLIPGRDVIRELLDSGPGDLVIVPSSAVRDGAFVDDVTLEQVQEAVRRPVSAVSPMPGALVRHVLSLGA